MTLGAAAARVARQHAGVLDLRQLFPLLALAFALLALVSALRRRQWRGAPLTWGWIACVFGAVAWWLHRAG
jgi:apolipoprotein N-acyltransferase